MESFRPWYMDGSDEDQRLPHHREPKEYVSFSRLNETDEELKKIRAERGYTYVDFCDLCPKRMPNYEQKIKNFFEEHIHTDEEISYCVDVSGNFTIRKRQHLDLLEPVCVHHRSFSYDYILVGPVWNPYNRPHDELLARKEYLDTFGIVQHDYLLYLVYFGIVLWELLTNRCHLRVCPTCRLLMLLHLR
ncbi:hypothetical protein MKX03_007617 [Papaver bracteatum]|nr:hypothetical protein MKX03_007617 [Papaver bracteatum]